MGSIIFLAVIICMFIFGLMLYFGSFFYAYFFSRSGRNILFRDYYECGFKSISDNRNVVDIHFFVIGLIFLIYDMEIILFIPLLLNIYSYSLIIVFIILFFFLLLGLSFWYEWEKFALDVSFL